MPGVMSEAPHLVFDRSLLAMRRARAATSLADHDFLARRAAEDLADRLSLIKREFPAVLNLGAGWGGLADTLKRRPGTVSVVDADIVPDVLSSNAGPAAVIDEECLPFGPETLDLATSVLTLQAVNDLPGALIQIRRALRPDGLFLATMLGARTLYELREAFVAAETEVEGGASPRVAPFADVRDLGGLLQRAGFTLPVADSDTVEVGYSNALELMRDLRGMGWTNTLLDRRRTLLKRATLMRAVEIYAERHSRDDGRVRATFELITLTGWAPADSQPKPLRPGSARARLADALGVEESSADDPATPPDRRR
jgi:NADH dehydrogenase [ubiquinone] 1 alpha subcomplex assembly factor 5